MVEIRHRFMVFSCLYFLMSTPLLGAELARAPVKETPATRSPLAEATERFWREVDCLARNVYWEAVADGEEGQRAVAAVTLNRVATPGFPDTICGVVNQGAPRGQVREDWPQTCQFSWRCTGRAHRRPPEGAAWEQALAVALEAILSPEENTLDGALYFHAVYVRPKWSHRLNYVGRIGGHLFYR